MSRAQRPSLFRYHRSRHNGDIPSPALVKAALINSAVDMNAPRASAAIPNSDEGWGRVALTNLIGSARRLELVDQTRLLSTGETYEQRLIVASATQPLKITLAYTDVPGLPAALPALVNDLDLEVVAPDGKLYRGNQFVNGESVEDAATADNVNNVEAVHLAVPLPGAYLIRVRARNIVEDVHQRSGVPPGQDFALVASGDLPPPGTGVVLLDRAAYSAPGIIQLQLIDADLAGRSSATVLLRSASELAGELALLHSLGTTGIFTGAVRTVTGPPLPDGQLQIKDGDWIEAVYQDLSAGTTRIAQAMADLFPPQISAVTATNHFGNEAIGWHTDEPAQSIVVYGTNLSQMMAVTNSAYSSDHAVEAQDLVADATYQFYVISIDRAGNATTNNNAGQLYRFVAHSPATVLLVNASVPVDPSFGVPEVPLAGFTDALGQAHVSYEVWDLTDPARPSPSLNDLKPFEVVIWRLSDNLFSDSTLTPSQQSTLRSYVNSGGALFIASMELLSRLDTNSTFASSVLQIRGVDENVGVLEVTGLDNDPISNGMDLHLDYSVYDNSVLQSLGQTPNVSDTLTVVPTPPPSSSTPLRAMPPACATPEPAATAPAASSSFLFLWMPFPKAGMLRTTGWHCSKKSSASWLPARVGPARSASIARPTPCRI